MKRCKHMFTPSYGEAKCRLCLIEELHNENKELKAELLEEKNKNRALLDPTGLILPPLEKDDE